MWLASFLGAPWPDDSSMSDAPRRCGDFEPRPIPVAAQRVRRLDDAVIIWAVRPTPGTEHSGSKERQAEPLTPYHMAALPSPQAARYAAATGIVRAAQ